MLSMDGLEKFFASIQPYWLTRLKGSRYLMGKWGIDSHLEEFNPYNDANECLVGPVPVDPFI